MQLISTHTQRQRDAHTHTRMRCLMMEWTENENEWFHSSAINCSHFDLRLRRCRRRLRLRLRLCCFFIVLHSGHAKASPVDGCLCYSFMLSLLLLSAWWNKATVNLQKVVSASYLSPSRPWGGGADKMKQSTVNGVGGGSYPKPRETSWSGD